MHRNEYIDYVKGFAVILVLVGHSIQFGQEVISCLDDKVFMSIYSFHMPLFAIVSGYLFEYTASKYELVEVITSKTKKLVFPVVIWSIVPYIYSGIWRNPYGIYYKLKDYIKLTITNVWFIWAIYVCSILVIVTRKLFNDNVFVYLIVNIIMFVTPDLYNWSYYKFMYSFFVMGYFYNKLGGCNVLKKNTMKRLRIVEVVTLILWLILLSFYNRDSYIYTTGYSILGKVWARQLLIDIYRLVIGFVGATLFLIILKELYVISRKRAINILSEVGKCSMGIYIISTYIFRFIFPLFSYTIKKNIGFYVGLETLIVLLTSWAIVCMIRKSNKLNAVLLGGRA